MVQEVVQSSGEATTNSSISLDGGTDDSDGEHETDSTAVVDFDTESLDPLEEERTVVREEVNDVRRSDRRLQGSEDLEDSHSRSSYSRQNPKKRSDGRRRRETATKEITKKPGQHEQGAGLRGQRLSTGTDSFSGSSTNNTIYSPFRRLQRSILGRPTTIPENQPLLPLYYQQDTGVITTSTLVSKMIEPKSSLVVAADSYGETTTNEHQQQQINGASYGDGTTETPLSWQRQRQSSSSPAAGNTSGGRRTGGSSNTDDALPHANTTPAITSSLSGKDSKKSKSISRKVVKAAVVKPARAVSRVFRGSSSKSSSSSNIASAGATNTRHVANGEADALLGSGVLPHRGRGYGALDLSTHDTILSADGTILDNITVGSVVRRLDGDSVNRQYPPGSSGHSFVAGNKPFDWPVHSVEALTRHIVLACIAYIFGAHHPEWLSQMARAAEIGVTAWMTCLAILILSFVQGRFPHLLGSNDPQSQYSALENSLPSQNKRRRITTCDNDRSQEPTLLSPNHHDPNQDVEIPNEGDANRGGYDTSIEIAHALVDRVPSVDDHPTSTLTTIQTAEHPSMIDFYVIDASSGQRVQCNAATPYHMSNEWFEMDMLVMIRTPDADDSNAPKGTPANEMVSTYMRGRQRRFEFQYQVKVKKKPIGKQVYFACELEETVKMGMVTKAFVGAAMAFVKSTNPTFHYSITGSQDKTGDGSYEKPHMSFTVEGSLDRLVVTKPGETPPQLGQPIYEDPDSIKRRKRGIMTDWNTTDTYTMALWTSYVDFLDWRVLNLPGIRPFSLSSVLSSQPIYLTMYMIDEKRDTDKHYRKDLDEVVKLEISNGIVSEIGPFAKAWLQSAQDQIANPSGTSVLSVSTAVASTSMMPAVGRGRAFSDDSNPVTRKDATRAPTDNENEDFATIVPTGRMGDDAGMDDIEEIDEDVETAAELGEGIYVRSGDSVVLRELVTADDDSVGNFAVGVGGGFAVLQEQDVPIVIEKVKSKKNKLIKSGDTVLFKMLQKKSGLEEVETLYLTIHRGWWLKWVSSMPSKNGFFTIYNHDRCGIEGYQKAIPSEEAQASYLVIGGSFTLAHRRWSKYKVGIAVDPSTTYGGRMLGLYNPKVKSKGIGVEELKHPISYGSDEESDAEKDDTGPEISEWMKPLIFSTLDPNSLLSLTTFPSGGLPVKALSSIDNDEEIVEPQSIPPETKLIFSNEHCMADVPAWIEMMDRVGRVRQLAYVVRVVQRVPTKTQEDSDAGDGISGEERTLETFVRLRTGRALAHVMAIGQTVRIPSIEKTATPVQDGDNLVDGDLGHEPRQRSYSSDHSDRPYDLGFDSVIVSPSKRRITISNTTSNSQDSDVGDVGQCESADADGSGVELYEDDDSNDDRDEPEEDDDEVDDDESVDGKEDLDLEDESSVSDMSSVSEEERHGALRKGKNLLGKSGKLVKKTVVGTGRMTAKTAKGTTKLAKKAAKGTGKLSGRIAKGTVKKSKKVVKGTVKTGAKGLATAGSLTKTTGKALIAPVTRKSHKPPKLEPKKKHKEKEDILGVSKRMRKVQKLERKTTRAPSFIAGELCAPEQSCRTASAVLRRMSSVPFMSSAWHKCNDVLAAEVGYSNEQDRWFLEGNAINLGVTPSKGDATHGELVEGCLVARCLWESHWREEWCGMYESCLLFYSPLSSTACLEITYIDITDVRPLEAGERSPLPGFPLLALETAWLCHYVAFRDDESRDTFGAKLEDAIQSHVQLVEQSASLEQSELRRARFWQGFQTLSETSLSSSTGKWAKVSSNQKKKERAVLNARRMPFDIEKDDAISVLTDGQEFVEKLLSMVLSFSLESLESDPENFVAFLDLTSQLRFLPLDEIDLTNLASFCLFVNLYHCLLQHALLLSVNGPLDKKSIGHFMRTSCYEVGGDVFSLAELQCCVIRGKMTKVASGYKPPYIDAPKKSQSYRYYALGFKDPRVHFVLNTCDVACPPSVPILTPSHIDEQLQTSSSLFLKRQMQVDMKRSTVVLPKVCEVFRNDFGPGDSLSVLKFCVASMEAEAASKVRLMLIDEHKLVVKYQHTSEQYHASLKQLGLGGISFHRISSESLDFMAT